MSISTVADVQLAMLDVARAMCGDQTGEMDIAGIRVTTDPDTGHVDLSPVFQAAGILIALLASEHAADPAATLEALWLRVRVDHIA